MAWHSVARRWVTRATRRRHGIRRRIGIGIGSVNVGRSYDDATTSVIRSYLNIRYAMLPSIIAAGHAATCGRFRSTRVAQPVANAAQRAAALTRRSAARCDTEQHAATQRSAWRHAATGTGPIRYAAFPLVARCDLFFPEHAADGASSNHQYIFLNQTLVAPIWVRTHSLTGGPRPHSDCAQQDLAEFMRGVRSSEYDTA